MYSHNLPIKNTSYFEDIGFHLKQELRKAKSSVRICVAWINWSDYTPLLNDLSKKGVFIEILYNDDYLNERNFFRPDDRIKLYPVKGRIYNSLMHNKFCIIDNRVVITGSFNWSRRAFSHFENIVLIENDFKLVKSFLHELEDLKNYFSEFNRREKILCASADDTQCRSGSYNLGILGSESGPYDESLVDVWNICFRNEHVSFLGEQYENHLHLHLGLKDQPDWVGANDFYNMDSMLSEFNQERDQIQKMQDYFGNSRKKEIHAIGVVVIDNYNEHTEWGEEPDHVISILWRDMYYRKLIPDALYDGSGDIECIIRRHL
jgi:hypothetical protein